GSDVFLRLPLGAAAAAVGESNVPALFADMMRRAASDGVAIEAPAQPGARVAVDLPGDIRARRARLDPATFDARTRLALAASRAAAAIDPRHRLMLSQDEAAGPADPAGIGRLPAP